MTKINCKLECGHSFDWGDTPQMPGADLPWVGRAAYCYDCESDQEIVECNPDAVDIYDVHLDKWGKSGIAVRYYTDPSMRYTYATFSTVNGIYSESEDCGGYATADDAEKAGREAYTENERNDTQTLA